MCTVCLHGAGKRRNAFECSSDEDRRCLAAIVGWALACSSQLKAVSCQHSGMCSGVLKEGCEVCNLPLNTMADERITTGRASCASSGKANSRGETKQRS
eukprot:6118227-Amphidinium_carterae.1